MNIISTKKLLISLILVMGIMMLGISNEIFAENIEQTLKVGQEFVKDGFAASVSFEDIKNDLDDFFIKIYTTKEKEEDNE